MAKPAQQPKQVDAKGRLTLGGAFANKTVLVEQHADRIVIRPARVVPEREAWLHENKEAMASVQRGIAQAREGQLSDGPDLAKAAKVAKRIKGE